MNSLNKLLLIITAFSAVIFSGCIGAQTDKTGQVTSPSISESIITKDASEMMLQINDMPTPEHAKNWRIYNGGNDWRLYSEYNKSILRYETGHEGDKEVIKNLGINLSSVDSKSMGFSDADIIFITSDVMKFASINEAKRFFESKRIAYKSTTKLTPMNYGDESFGDTHPPTMYIRKVNVVAIVQYRNVLLENTFKFSVENVKPYAEIVLRKMESQ